MKHYYLALACLFLPLLLQAQANFKKGWVVNAQGDTLHGYINYQEWGGKEPRTLTFKARETDKNSQEFAPATSRYVAVTGLAAYQSFRGRISMDATALTQVTRFQDTTRQAADIYLKVLQQGRQLSLFSYTDAVKTRFFLQQHPRGPIRELGFKRYYHGPSDKIRTLNSYIGQLWLTALELQLGTPALKKKIESAQYRESDLVAIVRQLNQAGQQEQEPPQPAKGNIRYFAGAGISQTTFTVEGAHNLARDSKSKRSYLPKVSLGVDVFQNRHIQRLFLRAELMLHLASADISNQTYWSLGRQANSQSFMQSTLSLAPQLVYNLYNRENFRFNLGIGASYNFSTYTQNVYHTQFLNMGGHVEREREEKGLYQFAGTWFSFPLRAGLILNNKVEISALYFMPAPITRYTSFSFSRSSLQLGAHYLFNRKQIKP
jgi:hypothetical protein